MRRADVGLVSLDSGKAPTSDGQIIVAVGKPAARALGGAAAVRSPHPMAVSKRKDTGETDRKVRVIKSLLQGSEDAQAQWENEWPSFVPPAGGQ